MDLLILQEIIEQLYCLYCHGLISSEQHKIFLDRLYYFFNDNEDFSYVQIIKYVYGCD